MEGAQCTWRGSSLGDPETKWAENTLTYIIEKVASSFLVLGMLHESTPEVVAHRWESEKTDSPSFFHRLVQSSAAQLTPILTQPWPSGPEDECRVGSRSPKKRENCCVRPATAHLNYTERLSQFSKHFLQDKKEAFSSTTDPKHRSVVRKTFQATCSQFHQAGKVVSRALFFTNQRFRATRTWPSYEKGPCLHCCFLGCLQYCLMMK